MTELARRHEKIVSQTVIIIIFEAVQIFSHELGTTRVGILVFTERIKPPSYFICAQTNLLSHST